MLVTCCYHLSVIWQDDAGMAKYVFNMCRLQLDFYKSHVSAAESPTSPRCVPFDFLSWVFAVWYLSAPSLSNWWGGEWWKNNISRRQLWWSVPLIDDPTIRQPGFDLPRRYWALLKVTGQLADGVSGSCPVTLLNRFWTSDCTQPTTLLLNGWRHTARKCTWQQQVDDFSWLESVLLSFHQFFDTVGWTVGRAFGPWKNLCQFSSK